MSKRYEEERLSTAEVASAGSPDRESDTLDDRTGAGAGSGYMAQLFVGEEATDLRARWDAIQTGFVDQPQQSVEQADTLVAETIQRLAEIFAEERSNLEHQWGRGDNVSTEDLRVALQRYRSFFDRLLSV